ncbi:MAG TPA: dienelactone hydrolase family protein [Povalibacter sp.]|nr:dienelactone hydrolase family protein [Povalibacter sp.]
MRWSLILIPALLTATACSSNAGRIDRQAHAAGLSRSVVQGQPYRHVVYANRMATGAAGDRLVVFLDGDGRPWTDDGQQPSADPTTRNPIALKLLEQTPVPAIYVSRPCYQELADAGCSPEIWTSHRYSSRVVRSIAAAIRPMAQSAGLQKKVVLVGYSGGGALAVLVAERIENVAAVITLSANLDIDAWTTHHGYLPLTGSLNPAASDRQHPWPEIHLQGMLDSVVPPSTTRAYFKHHPAAQAWPFEHYDHVCCWVDAWPGAFGRIQATLENPSLSATAQGPQPLSK